MQIYCYVFTSRQDAKLTSKANRSRVEDFGQTFPTPRDLNIMASSHQNLQPSQQQQLPKKAFVSKNHNNRSNKTAAAKRQPLAYYLPLERASPIIIGRKVLKEKANEEDLSKENRNLLANYLSAVDTNTITITRYVISRKNSVLEKFSSFHTVYLQT